MRRAPLRGRRGGRAPRSARADGWNAHAPRLDGDQPRGLGLLQRRRSTRPTRRPPPARARAPRRRPRPPRARWRAPPAERPSSRRPNARAIRWPTGTSAPIGDGAQPRRLLGELDEGERVAARRLVQPRRGVARHRPAGVGGEQGARRLGGRGPRARARAARRRRPRTARPTARRRRRRRRRRAAAGRRRRARPRTARRATGSRPRARRPGRSSASTPSRPSVAAPTRCALAGAGHGQSERAAQRRRLRRGQAVERLHARAAAARGALRRRCPPPTRCRAPAARARRRAAGRVLEHGGLADARLARAARARRSRPTRARASDAVDHIALAVAAEEGHPHSLPRAGPGRPRDPRASARRASPAGGGGELAVYASASRECECRGRAESWTGEVCSARRRTSRQDTPSLTSAGAPMIDGGGDLDGLQDDPVAERVGGADRRRRR